MGVYIPNIEKPKFCRCEEYNCFAWDDEKFKCKITEWKKPCPLIEIVECKDCKYWSDDMSGNMWCEHAIGGLTEANDFCSYGERREAMVTKEEVFDVLMEIQKHLIKCKDCKWCEKRGGILWCNIWHDDTNGLNFCSYAERRADETQP